MTVVLTQPTDNPPAPLSPEPSPTSKGKLKDNRTEGQRALANRPLIIRRATLDHLADKDRQQCMMGTTERHPLTGKIRLRENKFPDFTLIDLYNRKELRGTREELSQDIYVFRPRPLLYRTWMYHYNYTQSTVCQPEEDDSAADIESRLMKYVLRQRVIDRNEIMGRWSPMMIYVVITLFASLSSDVFLMVVSLLLTAVIYLLSTKLSFHPAYKVDRLTSLLLRFGYVGFFFWRSGVLIANGAIGIISMIVIVFLMLIDFYEGDFRQVLSYRFTCNYEIVCQMESRVFVVRQTGGAQDQFKEDERKWSSTQRIRVLGSLDKSLKLIADVEGVLFELEPVDYDLILNVASELEHHLLDGEEVYQHKFLGLEVFNDKTPTIQAVQSLRKQQIEEKMALADAKARKSFLESQAHHA